ncbi:MAG: hypothetical protein ACAI44_17780 [Candidatus Sericytochromatia bacterium]
MNSQLPQELRQDTFYCLLCQLAERPEVKTILEIGASVGAGSTEAFVAGLRSQPAGSKQLFTLEVNPDRFADLEWRYAQEPYVQAFNVSSVGPEAYASEAEVAAFLKRNADRLYLPPQKVLLAWRRQCLERTSHSGVPTDGIRIVQHLTGLDCFDLVLIDGSEFTGRAELELLYGAQYLCLDDILAFKNHDNYLRLLADPEYTLIARDVMLRHGFAVFQWNGPEGLL